MSATAAFFGAQIAAAVRNPAAPASFGGARGPSASPWNGGGLVLIECSSRPKKKATAHHIKTRPRKTQAWDIRREPTVYAILPPLPPDWVLASDGSSSDAAPSSLPVSAPAST